MLTESDRNFLRFVESHNSRSRMLAEAREQMGMSATALYARLHALAETMDAEREFPQLIHRVNRTRANAANARAERRIA